MTMQVLDSQANRTHGWKRPANFSFAAKDSVAPISIAELTSAIPVYPLAFIRPKDDEALRLVAVLTISPGQNDYINREGHWQAPYIPAHYRAYPFELLPLPDQKKQAVLCFNRESNLYREEPETERAEERFFDDEGKLDPRIEQILKTLNTVEQMNQITQRAVKALQDAGVLVPWGLSVPVLGAPEEKKAVHGLLRVNEESLNQLSADQLLALRNANALTVAYAQLFSMERISVLIRLGELRHREAQVKAEAAKIPSKQLPPSIDTLFGEGLSGGTISFDGFSKT